MEREGKNSLIKSLALAAVLVMGTGLAACSSGSSEPAVAPGPGGGGTGDVSRSQLEGQPRGNYVGSAACIDCHSGEHAGWAGTVHGNMIQVADADTMAPWAREQFEDLLANDPDSIYLGIGGGGGRGQLQSMDQIRYVVGGKWKQRYVVKSDAGHVFLRYQYYWSKADGTHDHWSEGDNRDDRWHDYSGNRVYEDRCLACHSTGFDLDRANTLDRTAADYTLGSVVTELGIGCESCHGAGKAHIASGAKNDIQNPANFTLDQQTQFCGSCHGRNAAHQTIAGREDAVGFKLGDTNLHEVVKMLDVTDAENANLLHNPGDGYYAGTSKRFHDDGASRSHRQEYNDMLQGPHAGKLSCSDCHDVHKSTPLQKADALATCNKCHGVHQGVTFADDIKNCSMCHTGDPYRKFEEAELEYMQTVARGRKFTQADLDVIMPKRAQSSNRPDIRTHTFLFGGIGKADPAVERNTAGGKTFANARDQVEKASYIGSNSCLVCHSNKVGWAKTVHGDMIQAVNHTSDNTRTQTIVPEALEMLKKAVAGDTSAVNFTSSAQQWAEIIPNWDTMDPKKVTYADLAIYSRSKDPLEIDTKGGRITDLNQIKYTVGSGWKQRYVVWMEGEGHVFLRWQYYASPDGDNPRAHSYDEKRVYEDRCMACHSTGFDLDAVPSVRTAEYDLEAMVAELGVGCESCHGPGSLHPYYILTLPEQGKANIINPANFKSAEQFEACGACHTRNDGTVNFAGRNDAPGFLIGDDLNDHVRIMTWEYLEEHKPVDLTRRFHADGASRAHRMQNNDMMQGPKAGMSCSTCHDVHNNDALKLKGDAKATDSTAVKFDALCASCHGPTHGYELDKTMPLRAHSSNVADIRTHTFILNEAGEAVGNQQ